MITELKNQIISSLTKHETKIKRNLRENGWSHVILFDRKILEDNGMSGLADYSVDNAALAVRIANEEIAQGGQHLGLIAIFDVQTESVLAGFV